MPCYYPLIGISELYIFEREKNVRKKEMDGKEEAHSVYLKLEKMRGFPFHQIFSQTCRS